MPELRAEDIHGWMSPKELDWLRQMAADMSSVAEIGCWRGRSTFALLESCKGPVYAVDHWQGSRDELEHAHIDATTQNVFAQFMGNVGHFPNLNVLRLDSVMAARLAPNVDMVFIDGCHLYDDVLADLRAWKGKARKVISGHDRAYSGVSRAINQELGDISNGPGSIWFCERNARNEWEPGTWAPPLPWRTGKIFGMDRQCSICRRTSDDGTGACRHCGGDYELSALESEPELDAIEHDALEHKGTIRTIIDRVRSR